MKSKLPLTQERVRELLNYDPDTGVVTWRVRTSNRVKVGDPITTLSSKGYIMVGIDGVRYKLHRIIFLYMTGAFPAHHIDHITRDRCDNRWCNLRPSTPKYNQRNMKVFSSNTSGVTGVSWYTRGMSWHVTITDNYIGYKLGSFDDFTEAVAHRLAAEDCLGWEETDSMTSARRHMQKYINGGE